MEPINIDFNVDEISPETVGDLLFSIPLYQRLYAWETEQVKQLLEDLWDTFEKSAAQKTYYIGNIVCSQKDSHTNRKALIDGQQRMTTFWLMGFVLREHSSVWNGFILKENDLRIDFTARDEDREFLRDIYKTSVEEFRASAKLTAGVNQMMANTISVVYNFISKLNEEAKGKFAHYVFEKSKFVVLTLPASTDLNKYFEIMNNRGVQLEKHEILKARLLKKIVYEDAETQSKMRTRYSRIWDACAQMNRDIEKSFEKVKELNFRDEIKTLIQNRFTSIDDFVERIFLSDNNTDRTLEDILKDGVKEEDESKGKERTDSFSSVINFPGFILHVYKLTQANEKQSLKDKDLLEIVQFEDDTEKVIQFLKELLRLRILFDQYVVRSYKTGMNNLWETRILPIDSDEDERKSAFEKASQILAMINVSTSTEHWLTPILKYLSLTPEINDDEYTEWLERFDNKMAYARVTDGKLLEMTNSVLSDLNIVNTPTENFKFNDELLSNGTATVHYWFFKLDYCLWKKWTNDASQFPKWKSYIKEFQFRSNRSIEHVYPQNPEDKNYWKPDDLNDFGNLALISVSSNSGYNNQMPPKKKIDFEARTKKWGIESLKLIDIYEDENWNVENSISHKKKMIKILEEYHNTTI